MSLEYWYMFPVAIGISTISIASGVAGATFYTPIFLLALGLPLHVAIGASLITATFGFASGLTGYVRKGLIDYGLGARLIAASVPGALLGAWLTPRIDPMVLRLLLGAGLLAIGLNFLRSNETAEAAPRRGGAYAPEGIAFAGLGGLFLGMISAGLGELNAYYLIRRRRMRSHEAVATSVLVVAATVIAAAGGHLVNLSGTDPATRSAIKSLVVFTIPGVVIGAQIGCYLGSRTPQAALIRILGVLFVVVAAIVVIPMTL